MNNDKFVKKYIGVEKSWILALYWIISAAKNRDQSTRVEDVQSIKWIRGTVNLKSVGSLDVSWQKTEKYSHNKCSKTFQPSEGTEVPVFSPEFGMEWVRV